MGNWGELLLDGHPGEGELQKNVGIGKRFGIESKKLWMIAGPITLGAICQYSLNAITLTFVGIVGEIELAAVSIGNSVISGLAFRLMLTFAVGNGKCPGDFMRTSIWRRTNKDMLGIYMQRSWKIVVAPTILLPIFIFAPPVLEFFGETTVISRAAGQ